MNPPQTLTVDSLLEELRTHPVNTNQFFVEFRNQFLTIDQLRLFAKQYHYFCFRFVKILEGLLYHTPIEQLDMRIELMKTLYSELGSGVIEQAHVRHLEQFIQTLGIQQSDLRQTRPISQVEYYLESLDRLFLRSDFRKALGAELAVETTAISEFRYFLPGLQKYSQFSEADLTFFSMHLQEEACHSDWLIEAVRKTATSYEDLELLAIGARETADAWHQFWLAMYEAVFASPIRSDDFILRSHSSEPT
jgi:pyrroloquinoline quinone (PQQ) biosynthesis protein C